jgi:hypothetical protein
MLHSSVLGNDSNEFDIRDMRVSRRIFIPKIQEVAEDRRKCHNKELRNLIK